MGKTVAKQIANEVDDVLDDVAHNLKKMARHLSEDAGDALSASAAALAHSTVSLIEDAKARSKVVADKAIEQVREHPAATAAIVAAAVAVIGLALSRRNPTAD